ncbi:hypothetical protein [Actibacterium sp.]
MGRIFKVLVFLIIVGLVGLVGYAYLGDLDPQIRQVSQPVVLDGK